MKILTLVPFLSSACAERGLRPLPPPSPLEIVGHIEEVVQQAPAPPGYVELWFGDLSVTAAYDGDTFSIVLPNVDALGEQGELVRDDFAAGRCTDPEISDEEARVRGAELFWMGTGDREGDSMIMKASFLGEPVWAKFVDRPGRYRCGDERTLVGGWNVETIVVEEQGDPQSAPRKTRIARLDRFPVVTWNAVR